MPRSAPTICGHPGCRWLVQSGRCDEHKRAAHKAHKQTVADDYVERNRWYQRVAWKAARDAHLASEPLCRKCRENGVVTVGQVVDHIEEITDGGAELDDSNLQTMCKPCHNSKTTRRNRQKRH